jgi:hypothetical protein
MRTDVPFPQDAFFGPEATRVMGAAFDKVCRSLHDSGQPSIVKEVIAKRIIDLSREGERDTEQLCAMTLKSLGFGAGRNCTSDAAAAGPHFDAPVNGPHSALRT